MRSYIEKEIATAQLRLDELAEQFAQIDREKAKAEARLETLRELLKQAAADETRSIKRRARTLDPEARKPRAMSATWRRIFGFIADALPGAVANDDLMSFIERERIDVNRDNLRSQLSLYTSKDYLDRLSPGRYRITDKGIEMAGLDMGWSSAGAGEPAPAEKSMEAAGPQEPSATTALNGSTPYASTSRSASLHKSRELQDDIPF